MSAGHRHVGFVEAITLFFRNYVNFQGRSSRGAYWWWWLASLVLVAAPVFISRLMLGVNVLSGVIILITLLPSVALGFRRLHDIGRSAWWLLLHLTGIGVLVLLFWAAQPGQRATNRFGPDVEAGR